MEAEGMTNDQTRMTSSMTNDEGRMTIEAVAAGFVTRQADLGH
jgi:hypothetical protein